MKKQLLAAALAALMTLSLGATAFAAEGDDIATNTPSQTAPVYTRPADVTDTDWYAAAADYVLQHGLMDASVVDGVTKFVPGAALARQEVAEAIYRDAAARDVAAVEDAGMAMHEKADYAEIDEKYLTGVSFCFYSSIMTGDSNNKLNPTASITREELAAVLERYYKYLVPTTPELSSGMAIAEFVDYADIQPWAHESIKFCLGTDMMKGNANGKFNPMGNVLRSEMAQILLNLETGFVEKQVAGLKLISK